MPQYERIDVSEGIEINKSNKSKECMICNYWYFRDIIINFSHMFVMVFMMYQWWFMNEKETLQYWM